MKKIQNIMALGMLGGLLLLAGCGQKGPLYIETQNADQDVVEKSTQPLGKK